MTERLLQFIWQFQYYNTKYLTTTEGEQLQIFYQGVYNTHQGPDFLDAKIKIGDTIWAGNIELHIKSSDWIAHQHSNDHHYRNIILHVVWMDDLHINEPFPVLELQSRVSKLLLSGYHDLMNIHTFIACEKNVEQILPVIWVSWKERLLVERLQNRSAVIFNYLSLNKNNWEETFWWMLAKNFGMNVNGTLFEKMAQSIPFSVLTRHKKQIHQLEALLLGQAGLLDTDFSESYPVMLSKEFRFYKKKYKLEKVNLPVFFLRMRPANFPTIRLAQLAMLIHEERNLFSTYKDMNAVNEVKQLLQVTANDYWHYHFVLDEPASFEKKSIGKQMISHIIINTIIPAVFAYGLYHQLEEYKIKAINWLQQLAPENNHITKGFLAMGVENSSSFDSQALIELKNEYCLKKRCLDCVIGNKIIREQNKPPDKIKM